MKNSLTQVITICVLGGLILYLLVERSAVHQPLVVEVEKLVEVPKEIEVEKIVEVEIPKEIEVEKIVEIEVPAGLSEYQNEMIRYGEVLFNAIQLNETWEAFQNIESFRVSISVHDNAQEYANAEELQSKIELILRRNGIRLTEDARHILVFNVTGIWDLNKTVYSYHTDMSLVEYAYITRSGHLAQTHVSTWSQGYNGYAGRAKLRSSLLTSADDLSAFVANNILKAREAKRDRFPDELQGNDIPLPTKEYTH